MPGERGGLRLKSGVYNSEIKAETFMHPNQNLVDQKNYFAVHPLSKHIQIMFQTPAENTPHTYTHIPD